MVQYHKQDIGQYIYAQMMEHFYCEPPEFQKPVVKSFTRIAEHNYSKYTKDSIHHYSETITPAHSIPAKVFSGFLKACHTLYKFDSKTEKDFAGILEQDNDVLKWLRPAANQFHIYWKHNSRQYRPDFVAETPGVIYLIETKKEGDMDTAEVREKSCAARVYCQHATEFTTRHVGKPWKYILIPHDAVKMNMGFDTLVKSFGDF
jgi:type III restriction enzyme